YVEATQVVAPPSALGMPNGSDNWISASVYPSGPNALEQYAIQLAESDAQIVGDGGNGYSLGQPETRAWFRETLALPAQRSRARPSHPCAGGAHRLRRRAGRSSARTVGGPTRETAHGFPPPRRSPSAVQGRCCEPLTGSRSRSTASGNFLFYCSLSRFWGSRR